MQEVIESRDGDLSFCALRWLCLRLLAFHWYLHITRELLPNGNDSTLYQIERWRVPCQAPQRAIVLHSFCFVSGRGLHCFAQELYKMFSQIL